MEFRNGCTGAPGCPGVPTHMYVPQGGFPVAYCVTCAPGFLKNRISTLPTTDAYVAMTQKVVESLSPTEPEVIETPQDFDVVVADDTTTTAEEEIPTDADIEAVEEAPKKTRRPRRKKSDIDADSDSATTAELSE